MKKHEGVSRDYFKFFFFFFLTVTIISFYFPASGDDLGWATSDGAALLENGFRNYNGRYMGNLSALCFSRIPALLPFIKSLTLTSVLVLIQKLTFNRSKTFLYLSAFLLVVPTALFKQAFVWTAGFANYYFSVFIGMFNIYLLLFKSDTTGKKNFVRIVLLFALGITGQLFMEHFTVAMLAFSVALNAYDYIKDRRLKPERIVYIIACVIGMVIMLTNDAYAKIFRGERAYQSLTGYGNSAFDFIKKLFGDVALDLLNACFPAMLVIFVLSLLLCRRRKLMRFILSLAAVSVVIFCSAVLAVETYSLFAMLAGIVTVYLALLFLITVKDIKSKRSKIRISFYCVMITVLTVPLLFVNPTGARCYSGVYVLLLMIVKELLDEYEVPLRVHRVKPVKALLTVMLAFDLVCYSTVFTANSNKVSFIRSEVVRGNSNIELEHTPLGFFVHALDCEGENEKFKRRFCEYYHLPENIEINYKD